MASRQAYNIDVLVIPKRVVPRLTELSRDEVSDLFLSTQVVGRVVERVYEGTSLTVAVQDGPHAGQSVPVPSATIGDSPSSLLARTCACDAEKERRLLQQ